MPVRQRSFTLFRPRASSLGEKDSSDEILPLRRVKLDRQSSEVTKSVVTFGCGVLGILFTLAFLQDSSDKSIDRAFFAFAGTGIGASPGIQIQQYDAVIIGAGWAGISAAKALLEDDVENILVLEAQDYIGGS